MKHRATFLVNLFLCISLITGLFLCLISSFKIEANVAMIIISTTAFCSVYALLSAYVKKTGTFILCVAVTMIIFVFTLLFSLDYVLAQLSYALTKIFAQYSVYLPVQSRFSIGTQTANYASGLFTFLSAIYSCAFTISLIRCKKLFLIAILSVLTLVPCFILVNTLPAVFALFSVITILLALYLTIGIRKKNPAQSGAFAASATAVVAVTLAVILAFNPIEGYERFQWQDDLLQTVQSLTGLENNQKANLSQKLEAIKKDEENLADISPSELTHKKAMSVHSKYSGTMYLKGIAYADYSDNKWQILSDGEAKKYPSDFDAFITPKIKLFNTENFTETKIITEKNENIAYAPYFLSEIPNGFTSFGDVCLNNDGNKAAYEFKHYHFSTSDPDFENQFYLDSYGENTEKYKEFVYEAYLKIPESTRINLFKIALDNKLASLDTAEIPSAVKKLVSESAEYSLDTPQMPEGKDFAVWFLNECDTGYCVHFATAATLMLRTLGIPARYVTGYYTSVEQSEWTDVSSDNAHAWVEYYNDDIGWVPLECTPASFRPHTNENSSESSTAASTVPETQITTEPSTVAPTTVPSTAATSNNGNTDSDNFKIKLSDPIVGVFLILGILILAILTIFLRRIIILNKRKRLLRSGSNKQKVINIYRLLQMLSKYAHIVVPDEITRISERAKFSNHATDNEAVELLNSFYNSSLEGFWSTLSPVLKLYYRFIVVLK